MNILLNNSELTAIVDEEDFERVAKYNWTIRSSGYVAGRYHGEVVYLHRLILWHPESNVDHINRNKLDNRKDNLRLCSKSENGMNSRKQTNCSSKYKGVYYSKRDKVWRSVIVLKRKRFNLGSFHTEIEAAQAYDAAAKIHFKQFANLNFK